MHRFIRFVAIVVVPCASLCFMSASAKAGTIVKLSLGGDSAADVEFVGGVLSTVDDGDTNTDGDQNTSVEFLDFLDGEAADILGSTASFTLDGLTVSGSATVISGALALQTFAGGTLELYDAANTLLLSGTLDESALAGPYGPPATGGLFTTTFGAFTGGTLAQFVLPNSLTLSMGLTSINGGPGLTVSPPPGANPPLVHNGVLNDFTADATISIDGEVPEPTSMLLVVTGISLALGAVRNRCR